MSATYPTSPLHVRQIKREEARPWILVKHYAHRMPSVSYAFGLYRGDGLVGVCTFGMPPSQHLCKGICGPGYRLNVLELNRLCLLYNNMNEGSMLVGRALRLLPSPTICVSYADTGKGHVGYVYQASNWIYTGLNNTVGRKNPRRYRVSLSDANKHDRHIRASDEDSVLIDVPLKHRYVYFVGNKTQKKAMRKALRYPVLPYPKGESKRYDASGTLPTQQLLFL